MAEDFSSVERMNWWAYVQAHSLNATHAKIAEAVGITAPSVSRWGKGSNPDPAQAAAFARAYNRPVLEAFIAAGFLSPEEAGEKPSAPPSLASLGDDELIAEVVRRMRRGGRDDRPPMSRTPESPRPQSMAGLKRRRLLADALPVEEAAYEGDLE